MVCQCNGTVHWERLELADPNNYAGFVLCTRIGVDRVLSLIGALHLAMRILLIWLWILSRICFTNAWWWNERIKRWRIEQIVESQDALRFCHANLACVTRAKAGAREP